MPCVELLGALTAVGCAAAMRAVDVTAVRPPLMVLLGTAAACVAVLVVGPGVVPQVGAALHLVGTVGVTTAADVPLDDRVERDPATWPGCLRTWTRWNTLRTVAATGAAVLLLVG